MSDDFVALAKDRKSVVLVLPANKVQCSKLRVHPPPGMHTLSAGCQDFSTCALGVCRLFLAY